MAGVIALTTSTPNALAADCSSPCKRYNQWSGGTSGGFQFVDLSPVICSTGCSWVQRGMWTKYSGTGTYIFAGVESTQTTDNYVYTVFKNSTGIVYHYAGSVDIRGDDGVQLTVSYNTNYGKQQVRIISFRGNGPSGNVDFIDQTTATETLWDVLQTGTRIQSISGASGVSPYTTRFHKWQCQSCGYTWNFQTNDGGFLSQGNAGNMVHAWQVPPHVPGSDGGIYETWCNSPNCP